MFNNKMMAPRYIFALGKFRRAIIPPLKMSSICKTDLYCANQFSFQYNPYGSRFMHDYYISTMGLFGLPTTLTLRSIVVFNAHFYLCLLV